LFLGYVVTPQGIEVDNSKVDAIREWPTPSTVTQIRSLLGLADFYRRFVCDFSSIAAPLHELTKMGVLFDWCGSQEEAFNTLKDKLTHAPLLQLPDFDKIFEQECDASGIEIGVVFSTPKKNETKTTFRPTFFAGQPLHRPPSPARDLFFLHARRLATDTPLLYSS
jgi:hypothetical protein